ncbi:zinc finger protein 473 homolog [Psammomys obesus]|uniref:zinc finger protein 473 homolog n=1 Tax=Psammomys obesus TaxID=48139 RepID=UPI0024530442|nr:zinc finger protein 473 homolog [Psammomys obesus]
MAEEFVTLKDVAMDFTLEDWEELELELGQEDLFWDVTPNTCQDLLLFTDPPRPSLVSQPDVREELEAIVRGGPEASSTEETKNSPLQQSFSEDALSQIMETFSKEELKIEGYIAY